MANGHSEEAIAATQMDEDSYRQQQLEEQEMREEEQRKDQPAIDDYKRVRAQRMEDLSDESRPMTRSEFLNGLVKRHNLVVNEDIWKDQHRGFSIIKLTGIEKIQANLNIRVTFEHVVIERDFAVIKATAIGQYNSVQSYGSVIRGTKPTGNHVGTYIVEMAEKRAKNRAVLKLCGAYKYGLYSEDESDDFKKKT
jgi:hypothetical protein